MVNPLRVNSESTLSQLCSTGEVVLDSRHLVAGNHRIYVPSQSPRAIRFGAFVAELRSGELYKAGTQVRLQEQPFKILTMLLARRGEVVTRDELRDKIWPDGTFVDFDHGINVAIAKIREVLGDCSDTPQFIATVGRRGCRFIAAIEPILEESPHAPPSFGRFHIFLLPNATRWAGKES